MFAGDTFAAMNLVTGATGMLGTHVMLELLKRGERVRALVRKQSNKQLVHDVFAFYEPRSTYFDSIEWAEGDVMDIPALGEAMQGCTAIYHTAAVVSYHEADRKEMYKVNVEGTANVVNLANELGLKQLCHVSSIAALGKSVQNKPLDEETEWKTSPDNSHYGITKHLAEMEVWRGIQEGLSAVIVNPGIIIGPGDFSRSSGSMFTKLNEGLNYYSQGGTGVVSANDCARMMVELMQRQCFDQRYILVGENVKMKWLFEEIATSLDKKKPTKVASDFILQAARWGEWFKEKFTGRKALITREMVRKTSLHVMYNNEKVMRELNTTFEPVSHAIAQTSAFFKAQQNK
jgi:dihydroflavonol-4-reductase